MPKEFIMRGQTASGDTEILNMSGVSDGYGYVLTQFDLFPAQAIGQSSTEMMATVTADNTAEVATDPNFNNAGLIATAYTSIQNSQYAGHIQSVINDLFVITQDLILMAQDNQSLPINWQIRFKEVKLSSSAEAVANYKQYTIYNTSS